LNEITRSKMMSESEALFTGGAVTKDDIASDNFVDVAGFYHFQVQEVIPDLATQNQDGQPKTPVVKVKCVVRHTLEGQSPVGKILYHDLYVGAKGGGPPPQGSQKNVYTFLVGMGVMAFKEVDGRTIPVDAETGEADVSVTMIRKCVGRHFIAKVDQEKDQTDVHGKTYKGKFKIPFSRVYLPGSPEVEKVPYNKAAVEADKSNGGFSGASGGSPPVVPDDEGF